MPPPPPVKPSANPTTQPKKMARGNTHSLSQQVEKFRDWSAKKHGIFRLSCKSRLSRNQAPRPVRAPAGGRGGPASEKANSAPLATARAAAESRNSSSLRRNFPRRPTRSPLWFSQVSFRSLPPCPPLGSTSSCQYIGSCRGVNDDLHAVLAILRVKFGHSS